MTVTALDANRTEIPTWGAAQDRNPLQRGVRLYRITLPLALNFAGRPKRVFQVRARGQCHLHQITIPGWNVSQFGPPSQTTVYDPGQPELSALHHPEHPIWASLPDASGTCRAILSWSSNGGEHYVLYEATETALLGLDPNQTTGVDLAAPYTDRLHEVRAAGLPNARSAFRRVQQALIPATPPTTTFEVSLPPGSRVIHFYALTVMNPNQVESQVAVPHAVFCRRCAASGGAFPSWPDGDPSGRRPGPRPSACGSKRRPAPPSAGWNSTGPPWTPWPPTSITWHRPSRPSRSTALSLSTTIRSRPTGGPTNTAPWPGAPMTNSPGRSARRSLPSPVASAFVPPDTPPDLHDLRVERRCQTARRCW